ncbi:hypothetical protein [Thiofilum flexile]|uniref:hypothetical protein n=1 Tax=Thiofilum flexile TaxID=125627 RepID=UPI00036F5A94|nr:hypothetical protein [Thiofilum flexile]
MKINKFLSAVSMGTLLSILSTTAMAEQVLEYSIKMADDNETYQVVMRPSTTPTPDISLTGQVTIRVPHAAQFQVMGNVVSTVEGSDWIEASRVDAPVENANYDYISFSFVGLRANSAHNYQWKEGEEKLIFSFKSSKGCIDGIELMPLDDPFNVTNNSVNTNPGNQFTNLGWGGVGENNYKGNYGSAIACTK